VIDPNVNIRLGIVNLSADVREQTTRPRAAVAV
jgi:hypothetical protein